MNIKDTNCEIVEARKIARQLNDLLHEDALHRLKLHDEYSHENEKWSPNLYHRCQLMEALCRKLNEIDLQEDKKNTRNVTYNETPKIAAYT
jgi:pyruvate-formate lyase-activating enzyme